MKDSLLKKIDERETAGNLRKLTTNQGQVDFVSNDYLGLARNETLFQLIRMKMDQSDQINRNGSGGSRLLSGNSGTYEELEKYLAELLKGESALVFNSGYQANLAIVSSIPQKGDTILYDQLSHICLKEGAWLSRADSIMFAHNDLDDLARKLTLAKGEIYVILESIYSMDGDYAPLEEIVKLCNRYDAKIIIDEAHSTGVHGMNGVGWVNELALQQEVFARVYTFGKAMGVHGACIVGSNKLKEYLINFARPFIYTTALPLHSIISIHQSFEYLIKNQELQQQLNILIQHFRNEIDTLFSESSDYTYPGSYSAVQPIIIPGNERIKDISKALNIAGFDVRPILSPTVKKGTERLRVSLHTYNTKEEITGMLTTLKDLL